MPKPTKTNTRYSEADLSEFKALIEQKLEKTRSEVLQMQDQVKDLNESLQDNVNDLGENSAHADINFINGMIIRQQKYIRDLENALLRIGNKIYGVCSLTGELIDKKRLLAVPTTTKSLQAKKDNKIAKKTERSTISAKPKQKKIETKIIRKSSTNSKKDSPILSDDFDDIDDSLDFIEEVDYKEVAKDLEEE